jgi:hypothetical protein
MSTRSGWNARWSSIGATGANEGEQAAVAHLVAVEARIGDVREHSFAGTTAGDMIS